MTDTTMDYLLPTLRLKIGDIDSTHYRYLDEWLDISLVAAIKGLQRYWDSKYLVSDTGLVSRNPEYQKFEFDETSGVIQNKDEEIIVIKAAIIILEGSLENSAWSIGSWKDAEISYSNIQQGNIRSSTVTNLRSQLDALIKSPMKRLTRGGRRSILEEVPSMGEVVPEDFKKSIIL